MRTARLGAGAVAGFGSLWSGRLKVEESTGNFKLTKAVVSHEPHYANNPYAIVFNPNLQIDRRNPAPSRTNIRLAPNRRHSRPCFLPAVSLR